jgi:hypothetical protein
VAIPADVAKVITRVIAKGPSRMKQVPKPNTDEDLIKAFLDKGGEVKKGKTKPMPEGLGLSNNQWGNTPTREEKAARKAAEEVNKAASKK